MFLWQQGQDHQGAPACALPHTGQGWQENKGMEEVAALTQR